MGNAEELKTIKEWKTWLFSLKNVKDYNMVISAYCPCQSCCSYYVDKKGVARFNYGRLKGKKKIVGKCADGSMAKEGVTLAAPKCYKFGTKIIINGKLLGIVHDRGGAIIKKNGIIKIDVYFNSHKEALKFGIRKIKI
jgi:3D (Asp-Asp-Asp) domain-containing protein